VVVVDTVDFPACCHAALNSLPPERVIVVGPEPDAAYRTAAVSLGAGGWVSRDRIGDELASAVRTALGCPRDRCPEGTAPVSTGATPAATGTAARTHQIPRVGGTRR
jgi:DNA-binding NarL/FixJ family response regulator